MLTIAGAVLTGTAGVCYALGAQSRFAWSFRPGAPANAYVLTAAVALLLALACDVLDGAVARLGNRRSRFGAFLDSTLDRFGDFTVYAGIAVSYAYTTPCNLTFVLLSMLAFFNAFMISYTKARAEDFIESCGVGFWQRPERCVSILVATFANNIPALVVHQAILPMGTVLRRISHTRAAIAGKPAPADPREGGWTMKLRPWRWPRMTIPYDILAAANGAWLIFAPVPATDWLRMLLQ